MRTMFDSIHATVLDLPDGADVYMGYDDGNWPDAAAIAARFPGRLVLRATTDPLHNEGQVLDLERGNATPTGPTGPGWVTRRRAAGLDEPLVYVGFAFWPAAARAFTRAGVAQPLWLVAAWDGQAELFPGAVGHQYEDRGTYDVSVIVDYLPGIDPLPIEGADPMAIIETSTGELVIEKTSAAGGHLLVFSAPVATAGQPGAWHVMDVTDALTPAGEAPQYTVAVA